MSLMFIVSSIHRELYGKASLRPPRALLGQNRVPPHALGFFFIYPVSSPPVFPFPRLKVDPGVFFPFRVWFGPLTPYPLFSFCLDQTLYSERYTRAFALCPHSPADPENFFLTGLGPRGTVSPSGQSPPGLPPRGTTSLPYSPHVLSAHRLFLNSSEAVLRVAFCTN